MKQLKTFLKEVLADPVAKEAFDRAQKICPRKLCIDGNEYHRRRNRRKR